MFDQTRLSPAARALLAQAPDLAEQGWLRASGPPIEVVDPSTGRVAGSVPGSTPDDVPRAVADARSAFDAGPWSRAGHGERSRALRRLTEVLDGRREALAEIGTLEVGSPIALSRGLHAGLPVAFFDWWADAALRGPTGGYQEQLPLAEQPVMAMSTLFREPVGVVAAITAYNFPLLITAFRSAAPSPPAARRCSCPRRARRCPRSRSSPASATPVCHRGPCRW
jgi:aldehyde dehydrogenase (NAD+)